MTAILDFDRIEVGHQHRLERTISVEDVDAFAALSGDLNPLHMDDAFARRTPFRCRVVHGLFTGALVSTAHTNLTGPGFVYVGQDFRFLSPVFIGDRLEVVVQVSGKKESKRIITVETLVTKQDGQRVLTGVSALKELSFE